MDLKKNQIILIEFCTYEFIKHHFVILPCYCQGHFLACLDSFSHISPIDDGFLRIQFRLGKARVEYFDQLKAA